MTHVNVFNGADNRIAPGFIQDALIVVSNGHVALKRLPFGK